MKRLGIIGVTAVALIAMGIPASAQACGEVGVTPDPGWPGAEITISGAGFTPGAQIFVNFGGEQAGTTTSNAEGAFVVSYTIPGSFPSGETNVFAQDGPANCEDNPSYTVVASQPTSTTAAPTTTTSTTVATTTTTAAPTTTSASTATASTTGDTTETSSPDTTVVAAPDSESDGASPLLWVLFGALLGAFLLGVGMLLGRRGQSD